MIEGAGSGSIPLTNGSGSGSRRPKNRWIRIQIRIRIRNSGQKKLVLELNWLSVNTTHPKHMLLKFCLKNSVVDLEDLFWIRFRPSNHSVFGSDP
jgi:hypothetical protein